MPSLTVYIPRAIALILASALAFVAAARPQHGDPAAVRAPFADGCTGGPGSEVFTREDIAAYGLTHLSDVFRLSTRWHATSIDGYHWAASPPGLAAGVERWDVYVNDVPVGTRLLGRSQLNALPVTMFDVACIELVSVPNLDRPTFSRSGSIRITTRPPDRGLSFDGIVAAANEINDPGPFRYTGDGGPNVDRIGPIGAASVSVNPGRWSARAAGRFAETHVTDAVLIDRTRHLYDIDSKPRIDASSIGLTGSVGPEDFRHQFLIGLTDTEDLLFFESVGLEMPAEHRFVVAGGSGRAAFNGGRLRYAASYARHELGPRGAGDAVDPDWSQQHYQVETDARIHVLRLGGGLRSTTAVSNRLGEDPPRPTQSHAGNRRLLTTRLFAGIDVAVRPQWRQQLLVEWSQRGVQRGITGYATADVRTGPGHALVLTGSAGHVLPDDHGLWTWIERDYQLPLADAVRLDSLKGRPLPRLVTLDAAWSSRLPNRVTLDLRGFFRQTWGDYLPVYERAFNPTSHGFDVRTTVDANVSATRGGIDISLRHAHGPSFRHALSYTFESMISGDETSREAFERIPQQRITYAARLAFLDRFFLSTHIRYTSASSWPGFEDAASRSPADAELSEYFLVDVAATKRMLKDHVTLSLALRNVLDEPIRYHPAGAVHHMALHVSVRLHATSLAGF
ncbi:MAG: hypothetical protein WD021_01885 [Rhodothermales bacterium]